MILQSEKDAKNSNTQTKRLWHLYINSEFDPIRSKWEKLKSPLLKAITSKPLNTVVLYEIQIDNH